MSRIGIEAKKTANPGTYTNGNAFQDIDTMTAELYSFAHMATSTITTDTVSPAPYVNHLVDASGGEVNITLDAVTAGDSEWFAFTLNENSNHCKLSVAGGVQQIQSLSTLSISTELSHIIVKQNAVDGYEIIEDGRMYDRITSVTGNIALASGFASGGLYTGDLADGVEAVITISNWTSDHAGDYAAFLKASGGNSTLRVVSEDTTFNEVILENNTGFTISNTTTGYKIKQDSRPDPSNITINFFPTSNTSEIEPTYAGVLETENPESEVVVTSSAITSGDVNNPTFLGYFINDDKALVGVISARNINGLGQLALTSSFNRYAKIRFTYHEYDYETNTLNTTPLSTTSYSALIQSTGSGQFFVGGSLPDNTWAETSLVGKTLVAALHGIKTDTSGNPSATGDNPTIDFVSGGPTPSRTYIDVPVNSVNHATLGGVSTAGTSVPDGHVDNSYPLQLPELTTAERDAVVSPNNGMILLNTTTGNAEIYLSGAWGVLAIVP